MTLEEWTAAKYRPTIHREYSEDGDYWHACYAQLGSGMFPGDGDTIEEALKDLEQRRINLHEDAIKYDIHLIPQDGDFWKDSTNSHKIFDSDAGVEFLDLLRLVVSVSYVGLPEPRVYIDEGDIRFRWRLGDKELKLVAGKERMYVFNMVGETYCIIEPVDTQTLFLKFAWLVRKD